MCHCPIHSLHGKRSHHSNSICKNCLLHRGPLHLWHYKDTAIDLLNTHHMKARPTPFRTPWVLKVAYSLFTKILLKVVLGGLDGKESACHAEDPGLIPGSGRCPGEGYGNTLQYSCLEKRIPRIEEPGGISSIRSQRIRHDRSSLACTLWCYLQISHTGWDPNDKSP